MHRADHGHVASWPEIAAGLSQQDAAAAGSPKDDQPKNTNSVRIALSRVTTEMFTSEIDVTLRRW